MAYISKIKLQDSVYEIIADKNTDKKLLATQEYVADAVVTKEEKIYKQNDEPVDAPDGAIWIDLDAESSSSSVTMAEVNAAIAAAIGTAIGGSY